MKKLVKPFENENEIQLANLLCAENGGCIGDLCYMYNSTSGFCVVKLDDTESSGDDILF
jgi:hypothetical protein